VSSINKSNNSSSSLPITENKKVMNNSAINNINNISNQNISIEIEDKNNLTTTIINKGIIEIPKVINQTLENNYNNYNNSLKAKFKKSLNKSLFYLKSKYNFLKPYRSKGFDSKKINFQNDLLELQNFKADSEQIWVASLDKNHNYLATGGKSGVVKIWKMNTIQDDDNKYNNSILFFNNKDLKSDEEIKHFLNIIDETAYKLYCEHSLDVIDLAWSKKYEYLLVSVSLDKKAVLYDINKNSPINIFLHKSAITSISFYPDKLLLINIIIWIIFYE
jgi:WD40 repeat protein